MTSLSVTVAAYGSLDAARADWIDLDSGSRGDGDLLDAVLIEREGGRVTTVHRHTSRPCGHGSIASAFVGVLFPPALLAGAVAGGVGGHTLAKVSAGLSRDAVAELGRVMDAGPFVTFVVADRGAATTLTWFGARSLRVSTLPMTGTARQLCDAMAMDDADA